jgi:FMN reductase
VAIPAIQVGVHDEPLVVGIGGTLREPSSTERALELALAAAEHAGARIRCFTGRDLAGLPLYSPAELGRCAAAAELVEAVRRADGLIVASPGYHGSVSGMVKNALDYLEDLRDDERPYLSGRSVGCIATGSGPQAIVSTLASLRTIVHALRGWPTPLGAAIDTAAADTAAAERPPIERPAVERPAAERAAIDRAAPADTKAELQLRTVGAEVVEFAALRRRVARRG